MCERKKEPKEQEEMSRLIEDETTIYEVDLECLSCRFKDEE